MKKRIVSRGPRFGRVPTPARAVTQSGQPRPHKIRWWYSVVSVLTSFLVIFSGAAVLASGNQDLEPHTRIPESGTSTHPDVLASGIHDASACSWGRNIRASFYASTGQVSEETPKIDHRMLCLWPPATRDECGEDKQPMPPISLLPAIGGSIATAIAFEVLRARRAAKMGLQPTQLSWSQNILASLPSLLLGLGVAIFLSALEVSLRYCFRGGA